jgi:hypothetical protein
LEEVKQSKPVIDESKELYCNNGHLLKWLKERYEDQEKGNECVCDICETEAS